VTISGRRSSSRLSRKKAMTNLSIYVPRIWKSELDAEATAFLTKYYPQTLKTPMCVHIEKIAPEIMHLKVLEYHLSEDLSILSQMCHAILSLLPLSLFSWFNSPGKAAAICCYL